MKAIKPNRLKKGDTVGVIAPAGPPNMENLERGIQFLKSLGLNIKMGKHVRKVNGYLAGTDQERLEDLHQMFLDYEVNAIICACGGYGTGRIASSIDYHMIKNNPKIFWGYSDITFLHTAIRQETGLATFHGPMLGSDIGKEDTHPLSKEGFSQLFQPLQLVYTEETSSMNVLREGEASGLVVGGNLSLIISTLGTRFEIDTEEKILFIEDVNEEPRVVDRMLNQLWMAGKLEKVRGILIGDFCECTSKNNLSFTLDEVIEHYIKMADKPAVKGLKIGHCNPHFAIPFGVRAELNTVEKKLIVDAGVM
ncbi:LD-carboxypeptidase [Neobacillus mesonae]|uniref:S66 peptidase family protein n=1 Tax=Neobacillus mesonae TaxID=1193713 RepID=UPI00203CEB28|nr:LD-carboxypeptidase [Neobacillus mesonae]MCM3567986.1 LD-carboxypeptidase [Neobacillus mesonae]